MKTKICKKCKECKPLDEYYNHPATRDKKLHLCKKCHRERGKRYEKDRREKAYSKRVIEDLPGEEWKDIDFDGICYKALYKISNMGRVMNVKYNTINKPGKDSGGYLQIMLFNKKIRKGFLVHRLVAFAFVNRPKGKNYVNHIDGDKTNNCSENLEWVTPQENIDHSYKTNLRQTGEGSSGPRLDKKKALEIRDLYSKENITQRELSNIYGVGIISINNIVNQKTYNI